MSKARIMENMTVKEIREGLAETKTVVLPVGCVEQHGYHLPISVDIHNGAEVAARASAICGCFVAPVLSYSFSGGMLCGTINVSPQAFSMVLVDICRSLVTQGFRNIIILLGHGGTENTRAAQDAAEVFQRLSPEMDGVAVLVVPFWELSPTYMKSFEQRDYHAGRYETSMMLYWKPELVRMDEAQLDSPEVVESMRSDPDAYLSKFKRVANKFVVPKLTQRPEIEVGVMGDYEGASAELGRVVADECAKALAAIVEELQ